MLRVKQPQLHNIASNFERLPVLAFAGGLKLFLRLALTLVFASAKGKETA